MPVLSPWMPVAEPSAGEYVLERNPYYYMVYVAGNQLPYIDRVHRTFVSNREVVDLAIIQGDTDVPTRTAASGGSWAGAGRGAGNTVRACCWRSTTRMRSPPSWVRATAADTLGDMGQAARTALPDLRASLRDEDPWVRHNALEAFATWGEAAEDARAAVTAALADPEPFVRFNAVSALSHLRSTSATTAAIEGRLADDHERVRYRARETLRRMAEA